MQVQSLGFEDPLEESKATHVASILAWRSPWAEEPGRLQFIVSQRIRQDWSNLALQRMLILMRGNKSNNLEDWLVNTESECQELDNLVLLNLEMWSSLKRYLLGKSNILGSELKFLLKYWILEKALLIFVCLLLTFFLYFHY